MTEENGENKHKALLSGLAIAGVGGLLGSLLLRAWDNVNPEVLMFLAVVGGVLGGTYFGGTLYWHSHRCKRLDWRMEALSQNTAVDARAAYRTKVREENTAMLAGGLIGAIGAGLLLALVGDSFTFW